jgi:hypothetical protein
LSFESYTAISRSDSEPILRTRWSDDPFRIDLVCVAVETDEIDALPISPCRVVQKTKL